MQFNSLYFILFFLPLTMLGYYLAAAKSHIAADWLLIGASLIFYGMTNVWYPVMLAVLIALNWGIVLRIRRARAGTVADTMADTMAEAADESTIEAMPPAAYAGGRDAAGPGASARDRGKRWMIFGVSVNVAFLALFKYTNFFIENLNILLKTDWPLVNLILPLGISFIIFSQISWIVDAYRGGTEDVCFREYALFSAFFPKLLQGPITLMRDFLPQLRREDRHRCDYERVAVGVQMFVCGLGKKLLLADFLGVAVDWYFENIGFRTNLDTYPMMLAYAFQIYFDFSGYSDMALGAAKLLGFDLPANFNSPYKACTVTDFWRRWHISLTTFLREYIYYPLGGSRAGKVKTYRNILIVYLVSGLWHGADWTFVLWGLGHGLAQVIERLLGKVYLKIWKPVRWAITFFIVNFLWMLFRSDNWAVFKRYWWRIYIDTSWQMSIDFAENFRIPGLASVMGLLGLPDGTAFIAVVSMILVLALCLFLCLCLPNNQERRYRFSMVSVLFTAGLLMVCLMSMSGVSTFIYNDF